MELTDLPNIGPKLAESLRRVGVDTPERFQDLGTQETFLRIRAQVDPTACFHQLTALAGAAAGIPKKALPQEEKMALRAFFDSL
ncbi:TfoX/Sxy family DNA transformation protein [uncultured Oscillibacter sp.]|uniref:TfoX/Sxy family DNA transformation protein n=1 Tax=uncultured Oscillibacter sp. TaxID=876091 RepID=UPI002615B7D8|nr:TfoX/Sxy family DNA transformation protein [uncultured Oscillibacter sp.]